MSKPPPLAAGTSLTFSHQGCLARWPFTGEGTPTGLQRGMFESWRFIRVAGHIVPRTVGAVGI